MNLTNTEKALLLEVLEKHIKFIEASSRSITPLNKGQVKRKNHVAGKLADLQNVKIKVEMLNVS